MSIAENEKVSFVQRLNDALTDELDGSNGRYRAPKELKSINADTDHAALAAFLTEYAKTPTTRRTYEKECERLLLWAVLYLNKAMSSLNRDDFIAYIEFLEKPDEGWCGKKKLRGTPEWRPFTGALSDSARLTAISSINSFFSWLVDAGYLAGNPLGIIRQRRKDIIKKDESSRKVNRYLDEVMWNAFKSAIEDLPRESKADEYRYERAKFMAVIMIMLGPRVSELSAARMSSFYDDGSGWFWNTIGKGSKDGDVSAPPDMIEALMHWRQFLGLTPLPSVSDTVPLLPPIDKSGKPDLMADGITPRRINQILDRLFESAAVKLKRNHPDKAEKILHASAHWGRHTSVTQKIKSGMDRDKVRQDARHSDMRTTNRYIHDEEEARTREAKKHKLRW